MPDFSGQSTDPEKGQSDNQTHGVGKIETYDDNNQKAKVVALVLSLTAVGLVLLVFSYTQFRTAQELSATQTQQARDLEKRATETYQVLEMIMMKATQTQLAVEMIKATHTQQAIEGKVKAALTQQAIEATLTPKAGYVKVNEKDGVDMVYVPAGEFLMGLTEEEAEAAWKECGEHCEKSMFFNEVPQHKVYLDAYWIYKTEVSNDMFTAFVKETQWKTEAELNGFGWLFINIQEGANWQHPAGENSSILGKGNHPVVQVSWQDAKAYCEWAGGRLPTEAEWEKAAHGTDKRKYPWGNEEPTGERLNYCDTNCVFSGAGKNESDGYRETAPVGSYPADVSPYGVLDMAGNVREWVQDWYAEDYYKNSPKDNPRGPIEGEYRVVRGSSWMDYFIIKTTDRNFLYPALPANFLGFRCVVSP